MKFTYQIGHLENCARKRMHQKVAAGQNERTAEGGLPLSPLPPPPPPPPPQIRSLDSGAASWGGEKSKTSEEKSS